MNLKIFHAVIKKIAEKHNVTSGEVEECFYNREKWLLEDTSEQHLTEPPTMWFIAKTDHGRNLKIVFIEINNTLVELKTAYEPNDDEVRIYEKFA